MRNVSSDVISSTSYDLDYNDNDDNDNNDNDDHNGNADNGVRPEFVNLLVSYQLDILLMIRNI